MDYIKNLFEKVNEQINNLSSRVRRLEKLPLKVYTTTRLLYAGTDGFPAEDADLTYNDSTNTLTVTNITVQAWQTPTLLNSWVNYGAPYSNIQYFKDPYGIVHIRGLAKDGTLGAIIFTLPSGYRPSGQMLMAIASNGAFGYIIITTGGDVLAAGSNAWISLDNISFRVA